MPSAKSLAGALASLFGRPEMDGWVAVRSLQGLGIIPKGRGGTRGSGAPAATSRDAAFLLIAMCSDIGPTEGVKRAREFAALPFGNAVRWFIGNTMAPVPFVPGAALTRLAFGDVLAGLIQGYRIGWPATGPDRLTDLHSVQFGCANGMRFGLVEFHAAAANEDGHLLQDCLAYGSPAPNAVPLARSVMLPASIFQEIARLLGPVASSSGGGEPLCAEDIGEDEASGVRDIAARPADTASLAHGGA